MKDGNKPSLVALAVTGVIFVVIIAGSLLFSWYRAGQQVDQYQRQGIHISQWDTFIGVKPAEQVIQLRKNGDQ